MPAICRGKNRWNKEKRRRPASTTKSVKEKVVNSKGGGVQAGVG
jgi:hypothetical protein